MKLAKYKWVHPKPVIFDKNLSARLPETTALKALKPYDFMRGSRNHSMIALSDFGDMHPMKIDSCENVRGLIVARCDKNFLHYWINKRVFPNLSVLYIVSPITKSWLMDSNLKELAPIICIPDCYMKRTYSGKKSENINHITELNERTSDEILVHATVELKKI
jgi:hypothetical protein